MGYSQKQSNTKCPKNIWIAKMALDRPDCHVVYKQISDASINSNPISIFRKEHISKVHLLGTHKKDKHSKLRQYDPLLHSSNVS